MKHSKLWLFYALLALSGCGLTQTPATVTDSVSSTPPVASPSVRPTPPILPESSQGTQRLTAPHVSEVISVDRLSTIAKVRQKNPAGLKAYVGQTLRGKAKFVKTGKGNPNATVADVRVNGVGEVSLWCRNVLGSAAPNRVTGFEGTLTGEVYTSEDFSHDVYLKDCRFRD